MERLDTRASGRIRLTGLLATSALHAVALFWLLSAQPSQSAQLTTTPIMVSLISAPEIKVAAPEPEKTEPVPKPKPRPIEHKPKPVLLAARNETPAAQNAPAPEPPPPLEIATAPVRAEAPITPPRFDAAYLQNPDPPYPSLSKRLREEGTVTLRVLVSADGVAEKVEVKKSSGFERLDQSALETVLKRYKFLPARRGDTPISEWVEVPVSFSFRK